MSGLMNKLGLGHSNTHDVAREAGHNHTAAATNANNGTTTTTTTTTNQPMMNNSSLGNSSLNNSTWSDSNKNSSWTDSNKNSSWNNSHINNTTGSTLGQSSLNNNSMLGNSSLTGNSVPYGATTNSTSARTGAAYTGQSGLTNSGIATQNRLSGDNAMTRSEEQLKVQKASIPAGVASLDKTVEVEHVEKAIPVNRERVVIEREPITCENLGQAMKGPEISEAHVETVLREDKIAASKETVPVERIRLAKQTETGVERVGADLRKEHVDLTMHDNSKTDMIGSNYGSTSRSGSLMNDKIDSRAGTSGLTNESWNTRDSRISNNTNTRNV